MVIAEEVVRALNLADSLILPYRRQIARKGLWECTIAILQEASEDRGSE